MMCPKVHIRVLMILAPICNKAYHVILEDMKIKILQKKIGDHDDTKPRKL